MFITILVILTLALVYWFPVRRWMGSWGTTSEEVARAMAGDSVIAHPMHSATQAVTVDATPDDIWPWLVQLGYRRGGLYSYDWLDRLFGYLDRPSATEILPQHQQLSAGDKILLGPRQEMTVAALEPRRALVLHYSGRGFDWVWQFALYPLDGSHTRLVTRGTEHFTPTVAAWLMMRVMEPAAFVMTRRMLLGLKQRAEMLRKGSPHTGELQAV